MRTRLIDEDWRGMTPLFWTQRNPYGKFSLDKEKHLNVVRSRAGANWCGYRGKEMVGSFR